MVTRFVGLHGQLPIGHPAMPAAQTFRSQIRRLQAVDRGTDHQCLLHWLAGYSRSKLAMSSGTIAHVKSAIPGPAPVESSVSRLSYSADPVGLSAGYPAGAQRRGWGESVASSRTFPMTVDSSESTFALAQFIACLCSSASLARRMPATATNRCSQAK